MSSNPNNIVYPKAKEYFMSGAIALTGGAYSSVATANQAIISVALISSSYPINNFATQSFYHDAVKPYVVGATASLRNWHFQTGSLDGNDITFTSVVASKKIAHVVLFKSGAVHGAADYLLAHYSTGSGGAFEFHNYNTQ